MKTEAEGCGHKLKNAQHCRWSPEAWRRQRQSVLASFQRERGPAGIFASDVWPPEWCQATSLWFEPPSRGLLISVPWGDPDGLLCSQN